MRSSTITPRANKRSNRRSIDLDQIKYAARGQWVSILSHIAGVDESYLAGDHSPCPKCGGVDRWRFSDIDGNGSAICNQCEIGKCGDGFAVLQKLLGIELHEAINKVADFLRFVPSDNPTPREPKPKQQRKDASDLPEEVIELRNRVYLELATLAGLDEQHRSDLLSRGFEQSDIDRLGYFSLDSKSMVAMQLHARHRYDADEITRSVPGVFPGRAIEVKTFGTSLAIPCRLADGRIVAVQMRVDKPDQDGKYKWFSSQSMRRKKTGELFPTSGTPCHVSLAPADETENVLRITEGLLKSDAATVLSGIRTIGVGGVDLWKHAVSTIEAMAPERLLIAFDNEYRSNPTVAKSLIECYQYFARDGSGIQPGIEVWENQKGVDDALLNDSEIRVLIDEEASAFIEGLNTEPKPKQLKNFEINIVHEVTSDGQEIEKKVKDGLSVSEIATLLTDGRDGWPKCCDGSLFVVENDKVHWLTKSSSLFAWINDQSTCHWGRGEHLLSKEEFFSGLSRHVTWYRGIELVPHYPPLEGHFYVRSFEPADNEDMLNAFLAFFEPADEDNAGLLRAALLTLFWGGPCGARPAFVITASDGDGTGSGKTTLIETFSGLVGGALAFDKSTTEERIRTDLLTPDQATKRVVMLDNIKSKISSEAIESLVTAQAIQGHRLFHGNASRPNTLVWFISANGAALSRDMADRSVVIKLRKPKFDRTWAARLQDFLNDHRDDLYRAIAFVFSQPAEDIETRTRWANWESDVLGRCPRSESLQDAIGHQANEVDSDAELADNIVARFEQELRNAGYNTERTPVHVPIALAAEWINRAIGEEVTPHKASRMINQLHKSGSLRRIHKNPSRANGRGVVWQHENATDPVNYELDSIANES